MQPPSGLVPAKVKQRSRTVLAGALLTICAVVLLAWSSYQLLASIRIFAVLLGESGLLNGGALGGFALGALLALVGSVTALVGLVRSRPRLVPALLFIAAMVLPAVAAAEGTHQGAQALGAQTVASVDDYAARIEPQDVNKVYDALEAFGIKVPGREQVIEGLNKLKGTNNPAAPTPTTTP
ncbi:hypothetical protein [Actinomyces bovis]|uniref:hypothetical protein n=1 Tax=Actinomyces bovis TaxID=1658 RepID=UPI000F82BEA6|nr:hypothetical protein [Actinomyces bovis]